MSSEPVRWAVLGTANIAAKVFLPAMRAVGGRAVVVGSRHPANAAGWASTNEVATTATYDEAVAEDDVEAVYVALPNDQHVRWAAAAVGAGKAVLCEKPIGLNAGEVGVLLDTVGPDALLWESFAFPFHPQTRIVQELIWTGRIGSIREVHSEFHFNVTDKDNIRFAPSLGGGALYDVGCYPVRLARLLFGTEPYRAVARTFPAETSVDIEIAGVCDFPNQQRLVFSAGMRRPPSTFTRIIGTAGELRMTNPFHPKTNDTVELWLNGALQQTWPADPVPVFQHSLTHVHSVLRDGAEPLHRAVDDSRGNAGALDMLRVAAAVGS